MALRQATPIGRDGGEGLARLVARYTRTGYVAVFATLLLLSLTSGYVLRSVQMDARSEAVRAAGAMSASYAAAVQLRFDTLASGAESLAGTPALMDALASAPSTVNEPGVLGAHVRAQLVNWPIEAYSLVATDGRIRAADQAQRVGSRHRLLDQREEWPQRLRETGTAVWAAGKALSSPQAAGSALLLITPVFDRGGTLAGALLLETPAQAVIADGLHGAGQPPGVFTHVFFSDGSVAGRQQGLAFDVGQRLREAQTHSVSPAFSGGSRESYRNRQGVQVLDAWLWLDRLKLGVITQISEDRALAGYHKVRNLVWLIFAVAIVLAVLLLLLLMRFRQRVAHLSKISSLDPLTQLANRRRFDSELAEQWQTSSRSGLPISLILIDVDCFKAYNDYYGHQAGDACLRAVAKTLAGCVKRSQDLVVRYGGEEFAVLMPMTTANSALVIAQHIQSRLGELKMEHRASSVADVVTVSMGVATLQAQARTDAKVLIEKADAYLYMAKESGRNRIVDTELN